MESSASMPVLSQIEDVLGWEPNPAFDLRQGQRAIHKAIRHNPAQWVYNAYLPTGYGKTICALLAYGEGRNLLRVNRALIIVPSDQQRSDFIEDLNENAKKLGLELSGHDAFGIKHDERVLRRCESGEAEIVVTTVQHINKDSGNVYRKLMSHGKWLVVCDEHHHYVEDKAWGRAVNKLQRAMTLGLSATPFPGAKASSVIGTEFDVTVSLADAYAEQAIRGIQSHILDYYVDVSEEGSDDIVRLTTSMLAEEDPFEGDEFSVWETKRGIRYNGKYLSEIIRAALSILARKLLKHEGEHQMLVFAMSCRHAKHICEMINLMQGSCDAQFAEWVGTGPDGRSDAENEEVIKLYKQNKITCLVQVDKAGEGFNNKRSSVLLFLNLLTGEANKATQQIGRGFRRNDKILNFADDVCDILISSDSLMVPLIRTLEQQIGAGTEGADRKKTERDGDRWYDIPKLEVVHTELRFVETFYPFGTLEETTDAFMRKNSGLSDRASRQEIEDSIKKFFEAKKDETNQEIERMSDIERCNRVQKSVENAVTTIVTQAIDLRYGKTVETSLIGAMKRALHTEWLRRTGLKTSAMTESEFRRKYEWIRQENNTMSETDTIPRWLIVD